MKSYLKTKDFSVSQEVFELLYDEEKELMVTHPKPKNLEAYYESEAYISHTDSKQTFLESLYQTVKKVNLNRKVKLAEGYCNGNRKLLDIGSGTGDFLAVANRKGWNVAGVEPNQKARQKSSSKGIDARSTLDEIGDQKFQVITLWHVLEHLPDLETSITQINKLLHDNGTLIVAVPNYKSWDANYYKEHWAAYDVPRHLWHFSKTAIETIFSMQGFRLVKTKPMWFDAFYVSILSEKYRESNFVFVKGILFGLWSNMRAMVTKECSSQIYILQKA
ncbi:class I SAM-dependent methyltransferase [Allomuricauda sp. d1]|uniref:class I SAM-dependent methyltransferase n=1 Tax=Allomuricauda sp. d1 TaxID=3136725 RepID=UPI0031E19ADE